MIQIKTRPLPATLPDLASCPPILQRIYAARGISTLSELSMQLQSLPTYHALLEITHAVERFEKALRSQEHIMIVGDFDADGATSTALAVQALKAMGAQQVSFLVPNRFVFGYGLTPELVDLAAESSPSLIVTVDNGIASTEGVAHANSKNIDVIITDHHLPGHTRPAACAIINPNQVGDPFLSKNLAGVGVIFYVMTALRRHLHEQGWFETQQLPMPNMAQFLDLVALGTIADVVPLDHTNRILVYQGLQRIRDNLARPGIQALIKIGGKNAAQLRAHDLGFAVAPRLNAAGRLDDMRVGIQCLLSDSMETAMPLATQLDTLNEERKLIEQEMREQAIIALQTLTKRFKDAQLPAGLCLMDPQWHQGVIGILAGRLKERYHRPVMIFAKVSDSELKGSGRSISLINLRDLLAHIDQQHPGLITKFGGHAMAAGMSLPYENFKRFQSIFETETAKLLPIEHCQGEIWTDGMLPGQAFTLDTARLLENAGPWGQQFPEPVFEGRFHVLQQRLVGQKHLKLTMKPIDGDQLLDAIAFQVKTDDWPNERVQQIHAVFTLGINWYQGIARLQLVVQHLMAV